MGATKQVLYAKLRPQGADIAPLCRTLRKVFVGYPAWRRGTPESGRPRPQDVIDVGARSVRVDKDELAIADPASARKYAASVNRQWGRIAKVAPGSLVLIPRLGDGIVQVAEILGQFQVFDPADWADRYLVERREAGLNAKDLRSHIGDVMQGWNTGDWVAVPFAAIPRWISQRALARDTLGLMADAEDGRSAWETMRNVIDVRGIVVRLPARTPEDVISRMHDLLSPNSFEQLCVELLQLENPQELWLHVGGSGDGGSDGLGYGPDGSVAAILQCKYEWPGEVVDPRRSAALGRAGSRLILASLVHGGGRPGNLPPGALWLGSLDVAALVIKHRSRLPFALSLGIEGA